VAAPPRPPYRTASSIACDFVDLGDPSRAAVDESRS
jgi:hypothetical protein